MRARRSVLRLVLRPGDASTAWDRWGVPVAPAADHRLPPGSSPGPDRPCGDLAETTAAGLDGPGDLRADPRDAGGPRAAGAGRAEGVPHTVPGDRHDAPRYVGLHQTGHIDALSHEVACGAGSAIDQGRAGGGRAAVQDAGDGPQGALDVAGGVQRA